MPRTIVGVVTSKKTDMTIIVTVNSRKTHPLYRKQYSVKTKFMAHDAKNEAQVGDKVMISETRPISARKRFILSEIVEKPKLREDSLAIVKTDDTSQRASKSKTKPEEEVEAKTDLAPKQPKPKKELES